MFHNIDLTVYDAAVIIMASKFLISSQSHHTTAFVLCTLCSQHRGNKKRFTPHNAVNVFSLSFTLIYPDQNDISFADK